MEAKPIKIEEYCKLYSQFLSCRKMVEYLDLKKNKFTVKRPCDNCQFRVTLTIYKDEE